jgi:hypothetical protein
VSSTLEKFNQKLEKITKPLLDECNNIRKENTMLTKEMSIMQGINKEMRDQVISTNEGIVK